LPNRFEIIKLLLETGAKPGKAAKQLATAAGDRPYIVSLISGPRGAEGLQQVNKAHYSGAVGPQDMYTAIGKHEGTDIESVD
jgi:hypothetical protein